MAVFLFINQNARLKVQEDESLLDADTCPSVCSVSFTVGSQAAKDYALPRCCCGANYGIISRVGKHLETFMQNNEIKQAIFRGDAATVAQGVKENLESGQEPGQILNQALVPPMIEVGDMYERGEVYVPEMLVAAHAMKAGMEILRPELVEAGIEPLGKIALGTVQGDIHDIGKNLVGMMLEGAGFEVQDLGIDIPAEKFVEAVRGGVDILGMSGLLTTTIPSMPEVIKALVEAGVRDQVKVMIGGAPVTEAFKQEIGADGYAPDAASAVRVAKGLLD
jgi:5-methyltetrahydrofolate--homocysteine methyltransferase